MQVLKISELPKMINGQDQLEMAKGRWFILIKSYGPLRMID